VHQSTAAVIAPAHHQLNRSASIIRCGHCAGASPIEPQCIINCTVVHQSSAAVIAPVHHQLHRSASIICCGCRARAFGCNLVG
jgi:hypothetical protein